MIRMDIMQASPLLMWPLVTSYPCGPDIFAAVYSDLDTLIS